MSNINKVWAIGQLRKFVEVTTESDSLSIDDIESQIPVVDKILHRILPKNIMLDMALFSASNGGWKQVRTYCIKAIALLEREKEIEENLGDESPDISAGSLHSWVWDGASSLWRSGHYGEAVQGAIRKLNAETQNKIGLRNLSETKLFNQAYGDGGPTKTTPRLHRMKNDGSDTFKSLQRGTRSFAEGIFAGIRNPMAHESEYDISEQEALEYLAALSVLARWVDKSTLVTGE